MAHRAEQIVDAARTLLDASATLGALYRNRKLSLNVAEAELPCTTVNVGDDEPVSDLGADNFAFVDSLLSLDVIHVVSGATEDAIVDSLMTMRAAAYAVLMADRTLGLAFVIDTRYGGATAPEISDEGGTLCGRLATSWTVHYRMTTSSSE